VTALQWLNIPVYNPRSKDYLEQSEVAQCLGAFIRIIDPQLAQIGNLLSPSIQQLVQNWVSEYDSIVLSNPQLAGYVAQGGQAIANTDISKRITPALPTILYRILSQQPFVGLSISKISSGRIFWTSCAVEFRFQRARNLKW
jgi:hypothetical protein